MAGPHGHCSRAHSKLIGCHTHVCLSLLENVWRHTQFTHEIALHTTHAIQIAIQIRTKGVQYLRRQACSANDTTPVTTTCRLPHCTSVCGMTRGSTRHSTYHVARVESTSKLESLASYTNNADGHTRNRSLPSLSELTAGGRTQPTMIP